MCLGRIFFVKKGVLMKNTAETALFFPMDIPYDVAYRNGIVEYPVGPHAHNGAEIYFTMTALPDVLLGDQVFAVPAGTLILIPPFCVHQLYHETDVIYERYVLNLQDAWLKNVLFDLSVLIPGLYQNTVPQMLPLESAQIKELAGKMRKLLNHSHFAEPSALADFFTLLDHITQLVKTQPNINQSLSLSPSQKKVNEIISYIQEHVRENLTISELAEHFFLHPDYLARLFKQHAHVSIGRYLTLQKITTAQELLRNGATVAEAAENLGFSSYAYFFKTFQRVSGISPSRYRALYAAKP